MVTPEHAPSSALDSPAPGPAVTTPPAAPAAPVPARPEADRCPGALRTFPARDGRIARVRLAGAPMTVAQARAVGDLADGLGDGTVWFTARSNVQLRGLTDEGLAGFAERLAQVGLLPSASHDRVRNVVVSPFAGDDLLAVARAYDAALCARPALAGLSGRFLVGLDDGSGELLALPLDIRAQVRDGRVRVALGTDPRGYDAGPVTDAGRVGDALADLAQAFLPLARAEEVWNVDDLSLPAREDLHAEVEGLLPAAGSLHAVRVQPRLAGLHVSDDGRRWVAATAPLATIPSAGWRAVADLAEQAGTDLRVTPWHAVVVPVPHLTDEEVDAALARLAAAGWVVSPDSPWLGIHGCSGIEHCAKSRSDVQAHTRQLAAQGPVARPVMIVGCERRCGHPSVDHLAVVATGPQSYTVAEHDGTHEPQRAPFTTVAPDALAGLVARTFPLGEPAGDDVAAPAPERAVPSPAARGGAVPTEPQEQR